ncbi:Phosphoserine aminotransferase [Gossypium arboreum]|uniref:Phosphoserine aminotransferase n=1 Tax=Gossypium arboreum TaxID=29729 RepID=A0A0B0PM35_GOSAR|nr:Phosphoserine aminotransferase [Gossypium arboreum]
MTNSLFVALSVRFDLTSGIYGTKRAIQHSFGYIWNLVYDLRYLHLCTTLNVRGIKYGT